MLFAGRIVKNEPVYRGKRGVDWENGGTWANVEKTANRVRKAFFLGLNVKCVENFAICITRVVTFRVRSLAWYIQGLAYEGAKRGCPEEAKDPVKAAKCFKIAANLVC